MKIIIKPGYENFAPFVRNLGIPLFFVRNGEILHDGRNTVKLFNVDGQKLVVKSFGHMTLFNRLIYGNLRKSKAVRAYLHSERLRRIGIDTPEGVAVLDIRRYGLLHTSYFISRYSDYASFKEVTEHYMDPHSTKTALEAFADFLFDVHRAGVLHNDLHVGNILFCKRNNEYLFQLIDTNRMGFYKKLSIRRRLKNLQRINCNVPDYFCILDRYASRTGSDTNSLQFKGIVIRSFFEIRHRIKRGVKRMIA